MSQDGGLVLISSQSPHAVAGSTDALIKQQKKPQQKAIPVLDAVLLDRIAKIKITDKSDNNNSDQTKIDNPKSVSAQNQGRPHSVSPSASFSSSSSSGIGSGEFSPMLSSSKILNVCMENVSTDTKAAEKAITEDKSGERTERHSSTIISKVGVIDKDDQHAKSLTLTNPVKEKRSMDTAKSLSSRHPQNQKGGHLSPAEFFQMSRLRASALANKLNTSATYGGSKDLVTSTAVATDQRQQEKDEAAKEKDKKVDSVVDELTKVVADVKLVDKKDEESEEVEKEDTEQGDGELIGRSPVPVYSNSRHVQHPYKQPGPKYPTPQAGPVQGYCQPKGPDGSPMTPADYLQQQRMRATPGQQYPPHQPAQYIVPPQQMHNGSPYTMYTRQAMMEECQNQAAPLNSYQHQPMDQQGAYSPSASYANQLSPCAVQQRCTNATPPASAWEMNQANVGQMAPAGSCSPMSGVSPEDSQGYRMVISPFEDAAMNAASDRSMNINEELNRFFLQEQASQKSSGGAECHMANKNVDELPEALSDFILKYSRRYSSSSSTTASSCYGGDGTGSGMSSGCVSGEPSPLSSGGRRASDSSLSGGSGDESGVEDDNMSLISARSLQAGRPDSCQSAVFLDSPQSGGCGSVPANSSPVASVSNQLTKIEDKSLCNKYRPLRPKQPQQQPAPPQQATQPVMAGQPQPASSGKARQRLREMIPQHEFDAAWAWAMRCCQACPGSLLFRDVDGDSLLHIVVWHRDLAKIYAITEILMKDDQPTSTKPIDLPNKLDETPLFLAVEKRTADIVAYLLECGANPNLRARNHDGDGPLHYAAARGMSEIVQLFCSSTKTNFNLLNGSGMTPLLCAVKNHGVIEEESQCLVNNKPTIRTLLKAGADPKIPDVASGKSVLHYCVERMDPDLVELFRDHLTKDSVSQLVNMPDYNGDTPLHMLSRMVGESPSRSCTASQFARAEGEEELRRKMLNTLIDCGADVSQCAGGLGDHGGSFVLLYPGAEQDANDDIQFTILDSELTPDTF